MEENSLNSMNGNISPSVTSQHLNTIPKKTKPNLLSRLKSARFKPTIEIEEKESDSDSNPNTLLELQYAQKYRHFSSATMQMQLSTKINGEVSMVPYSESVYASVLIADISGFTRLSAKLSVEELKYHINEYFTLLLNVVSENSGDVIKFLGDAVLIIWPVDKHVSEDVQSAATLMACLCALQLLKDCGTYDRGEGQNKVSLRLHCGIGAGLVHCMCMGEEERWEFLISGDPLNQVGLAESEAAIGEVCLSEIAYARVNTHFDGMRMPKGSYKLTSQYIPYRNIRQSISVMPTCENVDFRKSIRQLRKSSLDEDSSSIGTANPSLDSFSPSASNILTNRPDSSGSSISSFTTYSPVPRNSPQLDCSDNDHVANAISSTIVISNTIRHSYCNTDTSTPTVLPTHPTITRYRSRSLLCGGIDENTVPSTLNCDNEIAKIEIPNTNDNTTTTTTNNNNNTNNNASTWMFKDTLTTMILKSSRTNRSRSNSNVAGRMLTKNDKDNSAQFYFTKTNSRNNSGFLKSSNSNKMSFRGGATTSTSINIQTLLQNDENIKIVKYYLSDFLSKPNNHRGGGGGGYNALSTPISGTHELHTGDTLRFFGLISSRSQSSSSMSMKSMESSSHHNNTLSRSQEFGRRMMGGKNKIDFAGVNNIHLARVLRYFVHDAARSAVESNLFGYLSELRNVVTLFIGLYGLEDDLNRGKVHRPQMAIAAILACMNRFGGSLRQYVVDDKGCVVIIAFGLPGSSHEDNCSRAVETAVAVRKNLQNIGVECKQGVAEGKVYCGLVGTADRCEYAMMGASVNLAARLMGSCVVGEILVSDTVHSVARVNFAFDELPKIHAKGYTHPVAVFKPRERLQNNILLGHSITGDAGFVGRGEELRVFTSALRRLAKSGSTEGTESERQIFLLEGGPGVGKTRLVAEVLRMASDMDSDIVSIVSTAVETHMTSRHYAIRQLLEQVLGVELGTSLFIDRSQSVDTHHHNNHFLHRQPSGGGGGGGCGGGGGGGNSSRSLGQMTPRSSIIKVQSNRTGIKMIAQKSSRRLSTKSTTSKRLISQMSHNSVGDSNFHGNMTPQDDDIFHSIMQWAHQFGKGKKIDEHLLPRLDTILNEVHDSNIIKRKSTPTSTIIFSRRLHHYDIDDSPSVVSSRSTSRRKNSSQSLAYQSRTHLPFVPTTVEDENYLSNPYIEELLPLLGSLFNCRFEDNVVTASLSSSVRMRMTESLVLRILLLGLEANNSLVMIDNLQWVDIFSLRIFIRLAQALTKGVVIATSRPRILRPESQSVTTMNIAETMKRQLLIKALSKVSTRIELQPLQAADVKAIMERCIGAKLLTSHPEILSVDNVKEVMSRAGGSPFHAMVLAQGLRKALATGKFTRIEDLPAGAHNIIVARFDQLNSTDQAILKTASVIGLKFSEEELRYTLMKMGSENCAYSLTSGLHQLLDTNLIVVSEEETLSSHAAIYTFSERTVQESIYELMLSTMREDIHGIVGRFLELKYKEDRDEKLESIVFHYIRSNDGHKKIEYLKIASESAIENCLFPDALRYFSIMIKIATDMDIEDLFYYCYRKHTINDRIFRIISPIALNIDPTPPPPLPSHHHPTRASIRLSKNIGMDDLHLHAPYRCQWVNYSDIVKKLHLSPPDWAKLSSKLLDEFNFESAAYWIGKTAITHAGLGNLIECNNLSLLALYQFGISVPIPSSISRMKWDLFCICLLKPLRSYFVPLPSPTNINTFRLLLHLISLQIYLFLIRGFPIAAKSLVDVAFTIINNNKNNKRYQQNLIMSPPVDSVHINSVDASHISQVEMQSIEARFQVLHSLISISSDHNSKARQQAIETFQRVVGSTNSLITEDPIVLICRSVYISSLSEFGNACDLLGVAAEIAASFGDYHLQNIAILMKAWFSFLGGNIQEAIELTELVTMFASGISHSCLHIWALELDIMLKTTSCDFGSAENTWCMIKVLHRTETLGPTTRAIMAFSLTRDNKYTEAVEHTRQACEQLSQRQQCTPIGGFFLFCAAYAGLDILHNTSKTSSSHHRPFSKYHRLYSRSISRQKYNIQTTSQNEDSLKNSKLGQSIMKAIDALESMTVRFPCLLILSLTLTASIGRYYGTRLGSYGESFARDALLEVDNKLKSNKNKLNLFIFGYSYLHLERAQLCQFLHISPQFMTSRYDSVQLSRNCFRKMGMTPAVILSSSKLDDDAGAVGNEVNHTVE